VNCPPWLTGRERGIVVEPGDRRSGKKPTGAPERS
jgi:hypothetical protein